VKGIWEIPSSLTIPTEILLNVLQSYTIKILSPLRKVTYSEFDCFLLLSPYFSAHEPRFTGENYETDKSKVALLPSLP